MSKKVFWMCSHPGKGAALQQQQALWRHKSCGDLFSCKSILKEVNIGFVLTGVKWVELSGKIATIFNYQVKTCVKEEQLYMWQHLVKSGKLCHWLSKPGFPSVHTPQDHKHFINDCNQIQINIFNRPIFSRLILKKLCKMIRACTYKTWWKKGSFLLCFKLLNTPDWFLWF